MWVFHQKRMTIRLRCIKLLFFPNGAKSDRPYQVLVSRLQQERPLTLHPMF